MNLYTQIELQKRAWIADAKQADLMIDAIEASYKGNTEQFHCLMNKIANLHWLSESIMNFSCNCLTEVNIQAIVLKIEKICGSPCVPNPQVFLNDSIPDIIKYSE